MRAEDIKPSMIEAYQQKRISEVTYRDAPYKPASINREIEVMRRIYNLAMREEMVLKNPCWKVNRLSERNARDRVLSSEEKKSFSGCFRSMLLMWWQRPIAPACGQARYSG